jgi:hypothetical protein
MTLKNTIIVNKFKALATFLNGAIENINKSIVKRQRKLNFKDVFYYLLTKCGNDYSYDAITCEFKQKSLSNASKQSYIKFRKKINSEILDKLSQDLYNFCFPVKDVNKYVRYVAVDGSHINLSRKLKDHFKIDKFNTHCFCLLSCLFDINNNTPIKYNLFKDFNERNALIQQLEYLKKGDVLVRDRGYYSNELLQCLHNNGFGYIFRLTNACKITQYLKNNDDVTINLDYNKKIKVRLVKYVIEDVAYFLCTSIFDEKIDFLKKMYWKRWNIETHFRKSKEYTSMETTNLTTYDFILQDFYLISILFTIERFILTLSQCKKEYKVNEKNAHKIIMTKLLYDLLYNKDLKDNTEIINTIEVIFGCIYKEQFDRHNERVKKRPPNKWAKDGCRHGNGKRKKKAGYHYEYGERIKDKVDAEIIDDTCNITDTIIGIT